MPGCSICHQPWAGPIGPTRCNRNVSFHGWGFVGPRWGLAQPTGAWVQLTWTGTQCPVASSSINRRSGQSARRDATVMFHFVAGGLLGRAGAWHNLGAWVQPTCTATQCPVASSSINRRSGQSARRDATVMFYFMAGGLLGRAGAWHNLRMA